MKRLRALSILFLGVVAVTICTACSGYAIDKETLAVEWYRKAADAGYSPAREMLRKLEDGGI